MKYFKGVFLLTIVAFSFLVLTGCGKDLSAYAGTYEGKYTKLVGDEAKNEEEEFSLELKKDGTGVHNRDGESYNVTWTLDGEKFAMTETFIGKIEYTGTLKDGHLSIFNGDPTNDFTYEYVYDKK